jgi:DNA (cytosine-5)-methyltransferase 1
MLVNGQGRPINLTRPSQTIPATAGGYRTHFIDTQGVLLDYHSYLRAGGTPKVGEVVGAKRITTRESARLQSFPDDFVFLGPKTARYKLIGNAVPPLLGKAVGEAIYECLFLGEGEKSTSSSSTQLRLEI